jgi:hypothetical protein
MDDAAGFTQESHKCNNTSDWYDGSGIGDDDVMTFSWDASSTPECNTSPSAYAKAAPLWKEFMQELEEASPTTCNYGIGILKGSVIELKSRNAKRALRLSEGNKGSIISSKVKSQSTKIQAFNY